MEEFFEMWTWAQLSIHQKLCALLNINGYDNPLITFLDRMGTQQFLKAEERAIVLVDTNPKSLIASLSNYQAKPLRQHLDISKS